MSKLIEKILKEGMDNDLFTNIKKLKTDHHKNLNVNSVFKNKFVQKYRDQWNKLEDRYSWYGGRKKYGGAFNQTGIERKMVSIYDIYPGQMGVNKEQVIEKMNGEGKNSSELPEAVQLIFQGKKIILLTDGHHRVAADILMGKTEVELNIKIKDFI